MEKKISPVCIYIENISENESVCKKGLPPDIRCWTGKDNPCWYYSNYYEPDVDDEQVFLEERKGVKHESN